MKTYLRHRDGKGRLAVLLIGLALVVSISPASGLSAPKAEGSVGQGGKGIDRSLYPGAVSGGKGIDRSAFADALREAR